jgi:hypothetical protein
MFTTYSKKSALLLLLSMLAFCSFFVVNGKHIGQASLTNADVTRVKFSAKAKAVNHHSNNDRNDLRVTQQLSPQDWLAVFRDAYPADDNALKKLMGGINTELRPEFIEQLLRQVQFLAETDPVRDALEKTLTMKLANLDPPRAADYVIAALAHQKQQASLDQAQTNTYPSFASQQIYMPGQQFMFGHQLISNLMQSWGEKDLPQAIDWALALEDEQAKNEALNILSYTHDEQKIDLMADVINRLPVGNVRSGLLTQLAGQKAQVAPDAAVTWVSNWPDSPERNLAISSLISNRTSQSLEDTATLVEQALTAGMNPDETATDILINQWHYKSPEEAYQWAINLPDSAVKNRALLLLDAFKAEAATQRKYK